MLIQKSGDAPYQKRALSLYKRSKDNDAPRFILDTRVLELTPPSRSNFSQKARIFFRTSSPRFASSDLRNGYDMPLRPPAQTSTTCLATHVAWPLSPAEWDLRPQTALRTAHATADAREALLGQTPINLWRTTNVP